jgi:hypothetical protein
MPRVVGCWRAWLLRGLGGLIAAGTLLGGGEAFLRFFPPRDFRSYLGEQSGLSGPFRPSRRFGVQYRSWDEFRSLHAEPLAAFGPLSADPAGRPTWAMFGNSFVQAPGMLADTARAALPHKRIFHLGRNELLYVRLAQAALLLDNGLRPERLFVVLMPLDMCLVEHALDQVDTTRDGGLVYRPRLPGGPAGAALRHSRLALLGWVRTGRHQALPGFSPSRLAREPPACVAADLHHLFAELGGAARRHGVPVTLVLIPNHEQICRGVPLGFQKTLTALGRATGLDICDVADAFRNQTDKAGLFIPDRHFSPRGNRVLLDAILAHLGGDSSRPAGLAHGGRHP